MVQVPKFEIETAASNRPLEAAVIIVDRKCWWDQAVPDA